MVPPDGARPVVLGRPLPRQFLGNPRYGSFFEKPYEDLANPCGLRFVDAQAFLRLGPAPLQLLGPVGVNVVGLVAEGKVPRAAVVQHPALLTPANQVAEIANGGAVFHLQRLDAQLPTTAKS